MIHEIKTNIDFSQPRTVIRFLWVRAKFDTCTVVIVNGTQVEEKMRRFKGECANFIFNRCPIYTHDSASAKFSTNSQETDNSAEFLVLSTWWLKIFSFTYYDIVQAVTVDIRRGEAVAKVRPNLAAGQIVQIRQVRVVENNLNKNNSISLSGVHQRVWEDGLIRTWPHSC